MTDSTESSALLVAKVKAILAARGQDPAPVRTDRPAATSIKQHLDQVSLANENPPTEPDLVATPATRLPILGPLWFRLRRSAHQLVLFYVNRAVGHQTEINHELQEAITQLQAQLEAQEKRLAILEGEPSKPQE